MNTFRFQFKLGPIILTFCTELVEDCSAQVVLEYILDLEGGMCSSLATCTKNENFAKLFTPEEHYDLDLFLCNHLQNWLLSRCSEILFNDDILNTSVLSTRI